MNYPTREEFEDLKEKVHKLREQQTEPIKVTRIEIEQPRDQHTTLLQEISTEQKSQAELLQKISRGQDEHAKLLIAHSRSVSTLQENADTFNTQMQGARADISNIKATQSDHSDYLIEHGQRLERIESDVSGIKGDVAALKGDVAALKTTQDEQHTMLRQILQILGQKPSE